MKDVMVQGGANEKLLNNIIGNGPALESTGEINNDPQRSNRMIASLYECDIDANAWQYTTAEHVALLVQEKIKALKSSALSPRDFRTKADVSTILGKDGGRWGNIPIFFMLFVIVRSLALSSTCLNIIWKVLNWRSDTGWTLLHYAAIWNQTHLLPYLILAYGITGLGMKSFVDGMTPLDVAVDFSRTEAVEIFSAPFVTLKRYYIGCINRDKQNVVITKKFNAQLKEFLAVAT